MAILTAQYVAPKPPDLMEATTQGLGFLFREMDARQKIFENSQRERHINYAEQASLRLEMAKTNQQDFENDRAVRNDALTYQLKQADDARAERSLVMQEKMAPIDRLYKSAQVDATTTRTEQAKQIFPYEEEKAKNDAEASKYAAPKAALGIAQGSADLTAQNLQNETADAKLTDFRSRNQNSDSAMDVFNTEVKDQAAYDKWLKEMVPITNLNFRTGTVLKTKMQEMGWSDEQIENNISKFNSSVVGRTQQREVGSDKIYNDEEIARQMMTDGFGNYTGGRTLKIGNKSYDISELDPSVVNRVREHVGQKGYSNEEFQKLKQSSSGSGVDKKMEITMKMINNLEQQRDRLTRIATSDSDAYTEEEKKQARREAEEAQKQIDFRNREIEAAAGLTPAPRASTPASSISDPGKALLDGLLGKPVPR
jgi:hypothetical protein